MPAIVVRICLLAILLGALRTLAEPNPNASPWLRLAWSSDDGLPNNNVVGVVQTQEGILWLGTPNGLVRFDGLRFEEIPSTNLVSLPNRGIISLTAGRGGGLHLGMDRGAVVSLAADQKTVFYPDEKLSPHLLDSLIEDSQGGLWATYRNGNVGRIENGRMTLFTAAEGLPDGSARCSLACDAKGRLWFMKDGFLGTWSDGQFRTLKELPSEPARLAVSRGGGLWICSGSRLFKYTDKGDLEDHGQFAPAQPRTEANIVRESRDGAVWIGTAFSGLFRYDGEAFEGVPTTHPEILCVYEDAEGNIWVGTGGGGLMQIRPRTVTLLTTADGLPFEGAMSICEDNQDVIWAVLRNGDLARLVQGRWEVLPVDKNWAADGLSVCADPGGGIWVGTRYHGLLRWRDGRFVSWGNATAIKGKTVRTLVLATNGDVFLGEDTPGAIQRVSGGRVHDFHLPPDTRAIRTSVQDAAGVVWFGTSKGLLLRVDGDRLVDETSRTMGEPQSIRGLCGAADGSLWVAYAGWGVGRFKNGKFNLIAAREGLYDDYISQIIPDLNGWLWFGANRGLFKVRHDQLEAVAEGRSTRVRSVRYGSGEYGQSDWLPSLQANFGNSPNALRTRDGRLWFTMRTGLVTVDPSKSRENNRAPTVLLTHVRVGDQLVATYGGIIPVPATAHGLLLDLAETGGELRVPPDHRRLEIQYTALSFVGAENNGFRFRLEGVDDQWTETSQRNAVYPRLPAGKYRFQVLACSHEGIWNEVGAGLDLVVVPFFWQTWWFRGVMMIVFTGAVIGTVRYLSYRRLRAQLRHLEAQAALHKERARIAKDIHDDLGASLTQISLIGELARQDSGSADKVSEHVIKMSGTARRAVKSLDEIVWAVNPRNDTLAHFIDYTGQYALDFLRVAGLRCRLDLPEHAPARELSTDVRHNLFLVVKEAITNCVKHAQASELRLQITASDEQLLINVSDNGCGFERQQDSATADGLRNMRQRVADVGGECRIESRPGSGTTVSVRLAWPTDSARP